MRAALFLLVALGAGSLALPVLSRPALAFGLTDHEAITRQAVTEFLHCYPGMIRKAQAEALVEADLDEDTNLVRKWLEYSHYFHPEKRLDMWRSTSLARVTRLGNEITALFGHRRPSMNELLSAMGHLIHHLQDAASPPHVVPVNHWLTDGFETFEQGLLPQPTAADLDCQELARGALQDPRTLLTETARQTLSISRSRLPGWRNNAKTELAWSWFWAEGEGASFGDYGRFGNRFGVESIELGNSRYAVSRETYRSLKLPQLRLAIQATKQALAWAGLASR